MKVSRNGLTYEVGYIRGPKKGSPEAAVLALGLEGRAAKAALSEMRRRATLEARMLQIAAHGTKGRRWP